MPSHCDKIMSPPKSYGRKFFTYNVAVATAYTSQTKYPDGTRHSAGWFEF